MKVASRRIDLALAVVQRAALLAALWWALTGGGVQAWLVGAPLVTAGVAASLALQGAEPWRLQPLAALRALAWFGWRSLLAGWTVALRALRPRSDLAPGFITVRPRLRDPAARWRPSTPCAGASMPSWGAPARSPPRARRGSAPPRVSSFLR